MYLKVKSGVVLDGRISVSPDPQSAEVEAAEIGSLLIGKRIQEIKDWKALLGSFDAFRNSEEALKLGQWLNEMFGTP